MMEEDYVDPVGRRTDMETGKGQTRREQERERETRVACIKRKLDSGEFPASLDDDV